MRYVKFLLVLSVWLIAGENVVAVNMVTDKIKVAKKGYVKVANGSLYYEEAGTGKPLILIHGHSLDHRMWDEQFSELAKSYRTIRYDLRGYGKSSKQTENFQFTHVEDLISLMDSLHIEKAHIVGLSLGGYIGADMLGWFPERMLSAFLASGNVRKSPGPSQPMTSEEATRRDHEIAEVKAQGVSAMKREWLEGLIKSGGTQREKIRKPLSRMISDWDAWQPLHKEVRVVAGLDAYEQLKEKRPQIPVWIVEGTAPDNHFSAHPEILNYLPNGHLKLLDDCGHMMNMEQPEAFNALLKEMLMHLDEYSKAKFVHPGGLHTMQDLNRMKEKVASGKTPWIETWKLLNDDSFSKSTYKARPYTNIGGPGRRQQAGRDAYAAYLNTLKWYITGDTAHANCAVRVMNDWAYKVNEASGELFQIPINAMVQVAELLRTYPGWKKKDFEQFRSVARNVFYPACKGFWHNCTHQSWAAPAASSVMIIGVLCDDEKIVSEAVEYFKKGPGEGCIMNTICQDSGQLPEMGRDQPHAALGIASLAQLCQVAWNQGIDLFSYADNRLLSGFEYYCKFNLSHPVEWVPYTWCAGGHWFQISTHDAYRTNNSPVYEMIYNHYVVKQGFTAPYLTKLVNLARPERGEEGYFGYGTLTYTLDADKSPYPGCPLPSAPKSLIASIGLGCVNLKWIAPAGDVARGYEIYRSEDGVNFDKIAGWDNNTRTEYTDREVIGGKSFYYYIKATNQAGASVASNVSKAKAGIVTERLVSGWKYTDIGTSQSKGQAVSCEVDNIIKISSDGIDIGGNTEDGHGYVYTKVKGDIVISARLYQIGWAKGQSNTKAGLVIRESLNPNAKRVAITLGEWGGRFSRMGIRDKVGGETIWTEGNNFTFSPVWFKLERSGDVFSAYQSIDGSSWYKFASQTLSMNASYYVGLAVSAGEKAEGQAMAEFDQITVIPDK